MCLCVCCHGDISIKSLAGFFPISEKKLGRLSREKKAKEKKKRRKEQRNGPGQWKIDVPVEVLLFITSYIVRSEWLKALL